MNWRISIVVFGCSLILLSGCFWASPEGTGLEDGRLTSCPDSPNCVSTVDQGERKIEPLAYRDSDTGINQRLKSLLRDRYSVSVVTESDTYLRLTVTTTLGFVDDLEFRIVPEKNIVHVRSASRVGYSDLGANRERIDYLREHLENSGGRSVDG